MPASTTAEIAGGTGSAAIMRARGLSSRFWGGILRAAAAASRPERSAWISLLVSNSDISVSHGLASGAPNGFAVAALLVVSGKLRVISVGRFNESLNHQPKAGRQGRPHRPREYRPSWPPR